MGQFVIALLIGGFFAALVICFQYLIDVYEETLIVPEPPTVIETYKTNSDYNAVLFRDKKNHPWLFTDNIIVGIINYFENELRKYKGDFKREENIEISTYLCDKTPVIEAFIRESKRGKFAGELYEEIMNIRFDSYHNEKLFLLNTVFKEAHNTLIEDLIAGKFK